MTKSIWATAKGYVGVNGFYEEPYKGKYGEGIKRHYPSKLGTSNGHKSNSFHKIEYVVEVQDED